MVPAASNVHCLAGLCKPVCKRTRGASEAARFTGIPIGSPGVPKLNVAGSIPVARFEKRPSHFGRAVFVGGLDAVEGGKVFGAEWGKEDWELRYGAPIEHRVMRPYGRHRTEDGFNSLDQAGTPRLSLSGFRD